MSRGHRLLLLTLGLVVTTVLSMLAMMVFSELADLAFIIVVFGCAYILCKLRISLDARARRCRMKPFLDVLERTGSMVGGERAYQTNLLGQCTRLTLDVKPDSPIRSGTRVDGWMRFAGDEWYITIKKGLDNQQRLRLQGEIEDILLHRPEHKGHLWIIVIVGVPDMLGAALVSQINLLLEYTSRRAVPGRNVSINVYPV